MTQVEAPQAQHEEQDTRVIPLHQEQAQDGEREPKRRKKNGKPVAPQRSSTNLQHMGGIEEQLNALASIATQFLFPSPPTEGQTSPALGLLLHGPPGCGKT